MTSESDLHCARLADVDDVPVQQDHRVRQNLARRLALWTTTASVIAGTASAAYLAYAERRDQRRYPPPGQLLDIPGLGRRHLWRHGNGDGPPIVVVACLGGSVTGWSDLAAQLSEHTQILLYDRGGIGWSPPTRRWSTSLADQVHELEAVLEASTLDGPYILVGHSTGGIVARHYATRHPENAAALVMVDSSHEDQHRRLDKTPASTWEQVVESRLGRALIARAKPVGLRRLVHDLGWTPDARSSGRLYNAEEHLDAHVTHALGRNSRWGGTSELAGLIASLDETPLAQLGDLPLTVITGGPGHYPDRQRWYPEWQKLQSEIVATSTRSRQIVAPEAGHHVHRDDPDLVINAILTAHRDATRRP